MKDKYGGVQEKNFMDLWGMFIEKSSKKIKEANGNKDIPLIIWSNHMTQVSFSNYYLLFRYLKTF